MRLAALWVGKTRDRHLAALIADYAERVRRMARFDITELRDHGGASSERGEAYVLKREADSIFEAVGEDDYLVLCDERGTQLRSEEFASIISARSQRPGRRLVFLVGGYLGVDARIRQRSNEMVALSRMTLTHEMARLVLCEQLYRGLTILNRIPYQK